MLEIQYTFYIPIKRFRNKFDPYEVLHLGFPLRLNLENTNHILPTVTKGVGGKRTKAVFTARRRSTHKAIKRERYGEQPC